MADYNPLGGTRFPYKSSAEDGWETRSYPDSISFELARINNLVDSGKDPKHESLEDSFKDMANYAIIGLLVLRGQWDK